MSDQQLQQFLASINEFFKNTGVRMVYNTVPVTAKSALLQALPPALFFTPMKNCEGLELVQGTAPTCTNCGAVLNPACTVLQDVGQYVCSICNTRNSLPKTVVLDKEGKPAFLTHRAIEIAQEPIIKPVAPVPAFIFLVDTACSPRDLERQKELIVTATNELPDNAYVGLISFGINVCVHEVLFDNFQSAHVFRGNRVSYDTIGQMLKIRALLNRGAGMAGAEGAGPLAGQRFLVPFSECGMHFQTIVQDIEPDAAQHQPGRRPIRYTGAALEAAAGLIAAFQSGAATFGSTRVVLMSGGVCTAGAGKTAALEMSHPIRSNDSLMHKDDSTQMVEPALEYYTGLAKRFASSRTVVDVVSAAIDQTGLLEMRPLLQHTGGESFLGEDFTDPHIVASLTAHMQAATAELRAQAPFVYASTSSISISTPPSVRVAGCLGPCHSVTPTGAGAGAGAGSGGSSGGSAGEHRPSMPTREAVGQGGTNRWSTSSMSQRTTFAFVLQPTPISSAAAAAAAGGAAGAAGDFVTLQVRALYTTPCGQQRLRVVTIRARSVPETPEHLVSGLDAHAAACLLARLHAQQFIRNPFIDPKVPRARIDTNLVEILRALVPRDLSVGGGINEQSVPLPVRPLIPLIYHFRRSPFMTWGATSPDEGTYFRLQLMTDTPDMMVRMIAPELYVFKYGQNAVPAGLDAANLTADALVLFDCFFRVVLWSGSTVAQWRKCAEKGDAQYADVGKWLTSVNEEARAFCEKLHFPIPPLHVCDSGKSAERWIKSRINPSRRSTRDSVAAESGDAVVATEDLPLQDFTKRLMETIASK